MSGVIVSGWARAGPGRGRGCARAGAVRGLGQGWAEQQLEMETTLLREQLLKG